MPEPAPGRAARRPARHPGAGPRRRRGARRRRRARQRGARGDGPPGLGALGPHPRRDQGRRGELDVPVVVGGAEIRPGDLVVLDADGVTVVAAERAERGARGLARARGQGGRQAREAPGRRALLRARRAARVVELMSELAHLGPVELFTPRRREPARSSSTSSAWRSRPRTAPSTYLRGWGDYQRWSLKFTASDTSAWARSACAPGALRRWSGAWRRSRPRPRYRLDRRRPRPWPVVPLPRPRRPRLRALLRVRALRRARALRPPHKNVPGRYTGRGCAIKRLDHVNLLATDVRANREFCVDAPDLPSLRARSNWTTAPRRAHG